MRGILIAHKGPFVQPIGQNVQATFPHITFKRRVLVALGWNDPRTIRVIGQYARTAGWHLETRHFFDEIVPRHWDGDGLIVSYPQRADLLAFIRRQAPRQPTVLVGRNQPGIVAGQVMEDNREAGQLAARHFIERGHTQFAWITAYSGLVASDRYDGFCSALAGFRLQMSPPGVPARAGRLGRLAASPGLAGAAAAPAARPLACYVLDDQLASEAIEVCLANGWRVPEDFAVMGTGNIEISCECSHVPISSIDLGEEEIAFKAATLLDRLMRGRKPPARPIVIARAGLSSARARISSRSPARSCAAPSTSSAPTSAGRSASSRSPRRSASPAAPSTASFGAISRGLPRNSSSTPGSIARASCWRPRPIRRSPI